MDGNVNLLVRGLLALIAIAGLSFRDHTYGHIEQFYEEGNLTGSDI
jgi:hypothetical protein